MKKGRIIASVLTLALTVTSVCVQTGEADAAKKVSLKKTANVTVGKTVKLKLKNGNKKAKVTWKTSNKKVAKITKKTTKGNSASATVKGVKKGKAKITAVYKLGKKKTNLTCNVTVGDALPPSNVTPTPVVNPPATTASAAPATTAPATTAPTAKPTGTPKPTPTAKPSPTPTPTPSPTPYLVNAYKVDLSTVEVVGENGGSAAYDENTKAIESAALENINGFIIKNPITERKDEYKYVEITYQVEPGEGTGDINVYVGEKGWTQGADAAGWSVGFVKLRDYEMQKEVTICLGAEEFLGQDKYIDAVKIFNFDSSDTQISVKAITFYMDGHLSEPVSTEPPATSDEPSPTSEPGQIDLSTMQSMDGTPTGEYDAATGTVKIINDEANSRYLFELPEGLSVAEGDKLKVTVNGDFADENNGFRVIIVTTDGSGWDRSDQGRYEPPEEEKIGPVNYTCTLTMKPVEADKKVYLAIVHKQAPIKNLTINKIVVTKETADEASDTGTES